MDKLKLLLLLIVLTCTIVGALFIFGLIAAAFQWLVWIGLIVLVVGVAIKFLKKSSAPPAYQLSNSEREIERTDRLLEEIRRRQLMK